jgi:acyl-CoA thioesterase FadM
VPKIVNITVDYLRSARPVDVIACAKVTKQGRRMVNVYAEAWQDDRSKPVASASARAARMGVNPRTGEKVHIAATTVPKFQSGSALKAAVKSG